MPTEVYSIRLPEDIRKMMDEMSDVNWQAEIRETIEKTVRDKNKQRLLARMQERWEHQRPNEVGAAAMIREDRDAR